MALSLPASRNLRFALFVLVGVLLVAAGVAVAFTLPASGPTAPANFLGAR